MADALSATHAHTEEWSGEDVGVVEDVTTTLCRLREESAHETEGPDMRTSVMTHLAWVPAEWEEAAVETLAGLEERHPSRGILLFPEPEAADGIDAKVTVIAFPLREQRRHIAAEVIELRLRGRSARRPRASSTRCLSPHCPCSCAGGVARSSASKSVEQLVEVCDRLIVDSREWPDVPKAYAELPLDRAAMLGHRVAADRALAALPRAPLARNRRAADASRRGPGRGGVASCRLAPLASRAGPRAGARGRGRAQGGGRRRRRMPRAEGAADLERPPLGGAGRVLAESRLRGRRARGRYFLTF